MSFSAAYRAIGKHRLRALMFGLYLITQAACVSPVPNHRGPAPLNFDSIRYSGMFGLANWEDSSRLFYRDGQDTVWSISRTKHQSMPRILLLSSVFAGFVELLNVREAICGVDNIRYFNDSQLLEMHQRGLLTETGEEGQLNLQTVLRLKPDYVIGSSLLYNDRKITGRLEKNGIRVLKCDNFKEQHPLARAEWLKFFGFLLGRSREADSLFAGIEQSYIRQRNMVAGHVKKPTVLTDAMYVDAWNIPGATSYTAKLIEDAGGIYVFSRLRDRHTYPLNLETVLRAGVNADYWIHVNAFKTKSEMLQADKRYALFKAFKNNKVFNNNRQENRYGGNNFWELGVVRPDWVLSDLVRILSSEEYSQDKLFFYTRVD